MAGRLSFHTSSLDVTSRRDLLCKQRFQNHAIRVQKINSKSPVSRVGYLYMPDVIDA